MSEARLTENIEKMLQVNATHDNTALQVDVGMHVTTYSAVLTGDKTNVTILTPPEGYKLCIRRIETTVNGNAGTIALDFATSVNPVHRHYSSGAGDKASLSTGHLLGAVDEVLTLNATSLGSNELFIIISYVVHK